MKRISRIFLFGALTVTLLAAACAPAGEGTPTLPPGQGDLTGSPTAFATDTTGTAELTTATAGTSQATATNTTLTPSIPVTGLEVITLNCQYCVDKIAHAQLLIPRKATFEVVSPEELASTSRNDDDDNGNGNDDDNGDRMGCRTIDRFRDKKLVLCRAEENTTITLNICLDDNNCTEVQITLQSCTLPTSTPSPIATTTTPATVTITPSTITPTVISTTPTVAPPTGTPTPTPVTGTPTTTPGTGTSTPISNTSTVTITATITPTP
jgi:hypothetical protein